MTSLDVTKNTDLLVLYSWGNPLDPLYGLDVSKNILLEELNCKKNQLTSIDITYNTALLYFYCDGNELPNLDVTKNTKLSVLVCSNNQLSDLNISDNKDLVVLECNYNFLSNLDVHENIKLITLRCSYNDISSLDITQNISLKYFSCDGNGLPILDVSQNTDLITLYCRENELSDLDVTKNIDLIEFHCGDNLLQDLDVTKNTSLFYFWCYGNQLTSLNVSNSTDLFLFHCYNNKIQTSLDVSNNTALRILDCSSNQLTEISSFVNNPGLAFGDSVDVRWNNLSCEDWADIQILKNRIGAEFYYSPQNDSFGCLLNYLVNGDGIGGGSGRYWPTPDLPGVDDGYFDARFIPAAALSGQEIFPAWCADNDTYIRLGIWYENVGCYSSIGFTNSCADDVNIGNTDNLPRVNALLALYRGGYWSSEVTNNEIQAVIWKLLFNGIPTGGGINWDQTIVDIVYGDVMSLTNGPEYLPGCSIPIVIIIDTGDQVNLLEVPYWLYEDLVAAGIVMICYPTL